MSEFIAYQEAEQIIQQVIKRAQTDAEYRRLCLSDPNGAVREVASKEVPDNYTLRFVENHGADLTVVLPDAIAEQTELSDRELDYVAGGKCGISCGATGPGTCLCIGVPSLTGA